MKKCLNCKAIFSEEAEIYNICGNTEVEKMSWMPEEPEWPNQAIAEYKAKLNFVALEFKL